jgi:RHS repeat-associated protein
LLPNWSFESRNQFWTPGTGEISKSSTASTGLYRAAIFSGSGPAIIGSPIQLRAGVTYHLSLMFRGTVGESSCRPKVDLREQGTGSTGAIVSTLVSPSTYMPTSTTTWSTYSWEFVVPAGRDPLATITLFDGVRGTGTSYALDDVLLVEKSGDVNATNRAKITETVGVSDPLGPAYHQGNRTLGEVSFVATTTSMNPLWQPESTYLPYSVPAANILSPVADVLGAAKTANRLAGTNPVTVTRFADPLRVGRSETFSPGVAWAEASGRGSRSGAFRTSSLNLPTSFEDGAPLGIAEHNYSLRWTRDAEGGYAAQWMDASGRLLKSARLLDKAGKIQPDQWTWAITTYEYYPTGQLRKVVTPLAATAGTVTTSYDIRGKVVGVKSPDEGLVRFWYDQSGKLRYRQKASQIPTNTYTYLTYDWLGRLVSEGEVVHASMTQALADQLGSELQASRKERKGWIYDDLAPESLSVRQLPTADVLMATQTYGRGANALGQLVAKYHRNNQYTNSDLDATRRLVMEFYDYDVQGRVKRVGKYMGAIADLEDRRQNMSFRYDSTGNVSRRIVNRNLSSQNAPSGSTDVDYQYAYDDKGRVKSIKDGSEPVSGYTYDAFGRLTQVDLGGGAASSVTYEYGVHEATTRITARSTYGVSGGDSRYQYHQKLGYEAKADTDIPSTPTPSYVGRITQIREQFGAETNVAGGQPAGTAQATQALKLTNFTYDPAGRMTNSVVWTGAHSGLSRYDIAYADAWTPAGLLGGAWTYDANDRLDAATIGGATPSADYVYVAGGNRLLKVTGALKPGSTRNAGADNNFLWTADGEMTLDNSKAVSQAYEPGGLLKYLSKSGNMSSNSVWPLYDADDNMVTAIYRLSNPGGAGSTQRRHYIRIAGAPQKEIRETYDYTTSALTSASTMVNLIGQSSVVGRKLDGVHQYYLKNHQGSIVKVVDATGNTLLAYDYTPYGDLRILREPPPGQTEQSDKWTGKEYFPELGLYYFGARWYDPELGLWISPDPAHDEMSPYAYVGGDPMNYIDPYGLWKFGLGLTIGYDSKTGFNTGFGAALDFDAGKIGLSVDLSHTYGWKNDSWTSTASVGGALSTGVLDVSAYAGASYNDLSGYSVFGGAGVGAFGVGVQADASAYWSTEGDYMGALIGVGAYAGSSSTGLHGGYQWGMGGMRGMGWNAGVRGMGLRAGVSENGGWSWGASARVAGWQMNTSAVDGSVTTSSFSGLGDYYSGQWADAKSAYGDVRRGFSILSSRLGARNTTGALQTADIWSLGGCVSLSGGGGGTVCGGIAIDDESGEVRGFNSVGGGPGFDASVTVGVTRTFGGYSDFEGASTQTTVGVGPGSYSEVRRRDGRSLARGSSLGRGVGISLRGTPAAATWQISKTETW